jgi:DNA-binding NtrC family response regulator
LLVAHSWPGNVRELRNTLVYAALIAHDEIIGPEHLRLNNPVHNNDFASEAYRDKEDIHIALSIRLPRGDFSLRAVMEDVDRQILNLTLEKFRGNKTLAAAALKVNRKVFYRNNPSQ